MDLRRQAGADPAASTVGGAAGPHAGTHSSALSSQQGTGAARGALYLGRSPAPPLFSHQILKWPQPRALNQTVTKTMVNTVVANPTFTYLTALTDSNIVAIWKRY